MIHCFFIVSDKSGKPAPPPKPASLAAWRGPADGSSVSNVQFSNDMLNQLRQLKKRTKELRIEFRNLRRLTQNQAGIARETLRETCAKIRNAFELITVNDPIESRFNFNRLRLSKDEEVYNMDGNRLEKDLNDLELSVEELRSRVINRKCRVNMSDVESMALALSGASKTVADLKTRYPHLQDSLKSVMAHALEVVSKEEKYDFF